MRTLRKAYATTDDQFFFEPADAWIHQREISYPDIKLLDKEGNFTEDASKAESFIVSNEKEADFVEELTDHLWGILINHTWRAEKGSIILIDNEEEATCYTCSEFKRYDTMREMLDKYSPTSDLRRYLGF